MAGAKGVLRAISRPATASAFGRRSGLKGKGEGAGERGVAWPAAVRAVVGRREEERRGRRVRFRDEGF